MEKIIPKTFYSGDEYDHLPRFISYYHQIQILRSLKPQRVLEIGVGNKTLSDYLRRNGFEVTTCDLNESLEPDVVADIRDMPFDDASYEAVAAFEILEHLPWNEVPIALKELCRVSSKYVIISVPRISFYFEMVFRFPLIQQIFKRSYLDFFFRIPFAFFGKCGPSHEWEIGLRGYPMSKVRNALLVDFEIVKEIRPILNPLHQFFVLQKKAVAKSL